MNDQDTVQSWIEQNQARYKPQYRVTSEQITVPDIRELPIYQRWCTKTVDFSARYYKQSPILETNTVPLLLWKWLPEVLPWYQRLNNASIASMIDYIYVQCRSAHMVQQIMNTKHESTQFNMMYLEEKQTHYSEVTKPKYQDQQMHFYSYYSGRKAELKGLHWFDSPSLNLDEWFTHLTQYVNDQHNKPLFIEMRTITNYVKPLAHHQFQKAYTKQLQAVQDSLEIDGPWLSPESQHDAPNWFEWSIPEHEPVRQFLTDKSLHKIERESGGHTFAIWIQPATHWILYFNWMTEDEYIPLRFYWSLCDWQFQHQAEGWRLWTSQCLLQNQISTLGASTGLYMGYCRMISALLYWLVSRNPILSFDEIQEAMNACGQEKDCTSRLVRAFTMWLMCTQPGIVSRELIQDKNLIECFWLYWFDRTKEIPLCLLSTNTATV